MSVDIPDSDGQLLVPLGQETAPHPSGDGSSYVIKWSQDDEGRLVVLDVKLVHAKRNLAAAAAAAAGAPAGPAEAAAVAGPAAAVLGQPSS